MNTRGRVENSNYAQQPVIRNCRVEGLLMLVHLATMCVTR